VRKYFFETSAPDAAELEAPLWNGVEPAEESVAVAFEQYRLYVELADRVSARRALANTFFLTLNTAVFAAIGVLWRDPPSAPPWVLLAPLSVLVMQCFMWFWIIRSYRQLNAAKWAVVGAFERHLPTSPWWSAEWVALGEGRDPSRYWPLTHVEQWIPMLFALAYVGGFIAVFTSG
jgi:hypothetical protein